MSQVRSFNPLRWFFQLPFTLLLLLILATVAVLTNSHASDLSARWQGRLGVSARDIWRARWPRIFTAALVTKGGWVFGEALVMSALAVGVAEWMTSARRAAATFWGVHLLTFLAEAILIIWPLHRLGRKTSTALAATRDVGPSAGYFGALGLIVARLARPWRALAGTAIFAILVAAFFVPVRPDGSGQTQAEPKLFADLAHLIAFPLGWLTSVWER
ncbi:MAG: hypothetical protein KF753_03245 [Caldilineaceae bacterium]|nr:hypothetical protein [Caldilineaceae bacterium]